MPPPSTPSSVASFTLFSGPHHDAIDGHHRASKI
jgi:hypothetical protein